MKFSSTFLSYNIEVYDPLICNFQVWASDKRVMNFSSSFNVGQFESKCATFRTWSKYAN